MAQVGRRHLTVTRTCNDRKLCGVSLSCLYTFHLWIKDQCVYCNMYMTIIKLGLTMSLECMLKLNSSHCVNIIAGTS